VPENNVPQPDESGRADYAPVLAGGFWSSATAALAVWALASAALAALAVWAAR